jgi:hypothetical protein
LRQKGKTFTEENEANQDREFLFQTTSPIPTNWWMRLCQHNKTTTEVGWSREGLPLGKFQLGDNGKRCVPKGNFENSPAFECRDLTVWLLCPLPKFARFFRGFSGFSH